MQTYNATEQHVLQLFPIGSDFLINGEQFAVLRSGKPRPNNSRGECKTDVYVCLQNIHTNSLREIKISIKQRNADFLENKVSAARMDQIAGESWHSRYRESWKKLAEIVTAQKTPVSYDTITLGYRLDFFSTNKRGLILELPLLAEEVSEIYTGRMLSTQKTNAIVGDEIIFDSGVADSLLFVNAHDLPSTPAEVIDRLIPIDDFTRSSDCRVYAGLSAVNYRRGGKFEGSRPLALYWDHSIGRMGKIESKIRYDAPLTTTSTDRANILDQKIKEIYST